MILEIFLDSCVLQSYAIFFEDINHNCCQIVLNSPKYEKYTSQNVIDEVNQKKKKRLKLYDIILDHLIDKNDITSFDPAQYEIFLNDNDRNHLFELIDYLAKQPNILESIRIFHRAYGSLLHDAISKLREIYPSTHQPYLVALLADEFHKEDAKIVIDAYYWSNGRDTPIYVTLERRSLFEGRKSVMKTLHDYCELPPTALQLLNLHELIQQYPPDHASS